MGPCRRNGHTDKDNLPAMQRARIYTHEVDAMSFESWIEEFYPVPARECPKEQAAAHSLKKWQGALPENLVKHGVVYRYGTIRENGSHYLSFDSGSCALCHHYVDKYRWTCGTCPLFIVRDHVACFMDRIDEVEAEGNPFHRAEVTVEPMIMWLEKAVEYERNNK